MVVGMVVGTRWSCCCRRRVRNALTMRLGWFVHYAVALQHQHTQPQRTGKPNHAPGEVVFRPGSASVSAAVSAARAASSLSSGSNSNSKSAAAAAAAATAPAPAAAAAGGGAAAARAQQLQPPSHFILFLPPPTTRVFVEPPKYFTIEVCVCFVLLYLESLCC